MYRPIKYNNENIHSNQLIPTEPWDVEVEFIEQEIEELINKN